MSMTPTGISRPLRSSYSGPSVGSKTPMKSTAMKTVMSFAGLLQSFFTDRLLRQRQASPHTIASYRDSFRLLLKFASERLGKEPSELTLTDLDAPFVGAFLHHLEQ